MYIYRQTTVRSHLVRRFDGARGGDGFEKNPGFTEVRKRSREQESALLYWWGVDRRSAR
jgi:hypothetical protein